VEEESYEGIKVPNTISSIVVVLIFLRGELYDKLMSHTSHTGTFDDI
tara:strand:+ start:1421 stop:1561 length:141 start_codon:yes stop_codon:yes gene_type:complete